MQTQLNHVAYIIIETFKENGLDDLYIKEKTAALLQQTKMQSLSWACNYLDSRNLQTFADKIGVTVEMLRITNNVISSI